MAKLKRGMLTGKQAAFVKERRADPTAPAATIMERAGYKLPSRQAATERARQLMRDPKIASRVFAPISARELGAMTDPELKADLRRQLLMIVHSERSTDADKIKAVKELLATIPGAYVPIAIDSKNTLTLESLVHMAGGAPAGYVPDAPQVPRLTERTRREPEEGDGG